jgi:hypothetical protein
MQPETWLPQTACGFGRVGMLASALNWLHSRTGANRPLQTVFCLVCCLRTYSAPMPRQ